MFPRDGCNCASGGFAIYQVQNFGEATPTIERPLYVPLCGNANGNNFIEGDNYNIVHRDTVFYLLTCQLDMLSGDAGNEVLVVFRKNGLSGLQNVVFVKTVNGPETLMMQDTLNSDVTGLGDLVDIQVTGTIGETSITNFFCTVTGRFI